MTTQRTACQEQTSRTSGGDITHNWAPAWKKDLDQKSTTFCLSFPTFQWFSCSIIVDKWACGRCCCIVRGWPDRTNQWKRVWLLSQYYNLAA
jgi:acyl-coenzyme A synthetase/AMP-(fatty) acid ligase